MDVLRPGGVTIFILLFVAIALLECLIGIQTFVSLNPQFYSRVALWLFSFQLMSLHPMGPFYLFLVSGNFSMDMFFSTYIMHLIVLGLMIGSGLYLIASLGLLYMKKWGYKLVLAIGILNIGCGVLFLLPFLTTGSLFHIGILTILFGIAILWYFRGEVRYEFD
jgi:hypothetical protein